MLVLMLNGKSIETKKPDWKFQSGFFMRNLIKIYIAKISASSIILLETDFLPVIACSNGV